jgi:hypothetical protein
MSKPHFGGGAKSGSSGMVSQKKSRQLPRQRDRQHLVLLLAAGSTGSGLWRVGAILWLLVFQKNRVSVWFYFEHIPAANVPF